MEFVTVSVSFATVMWQIQCNKCHVETATVMEGESAVRFIRCFKCFKTFPTFCQGAQAWKFPWWAPHWISSASFVLLEMISSSAQWCGRVLWVDFSHIFVGYPKKAAASKNKSIRTEPTQSEKFQADVRHFFEASLPHSPTGLWAGSRSLGPSLSNVQHPASRTLELVNNVKGSQPSQKMSEELPGGWISLGGIRCKLIRRVFSIYFFTSPHSYPIPSCFRHGKKVSKAPLVASGAGLYGYWSGGWRFVSSPVPGLERHLTDLHWRPPRRQGATAGWDCWERMSRISKKIGLNDI